MGGRKQRAILSLNPDPFWASSEPQVIIERLQQDDLILDAINASAIRDRAAGFQHSDPNTTDAISAAFLIAVDRQKPKADREVRAVAWRSRAEAYLITGRLGQARAAYERATQLAASCGPLLGQILVGHVATLAIVGEHEASQRLARKAERLLTQAGDLVYLGKLLMNVGNGAYQRDDYAQAHDAYEKAARTFEEMGIRDATWVGLLVNQATASANLSRVDEARKLFLKAESHCVPLGLETLRGYVRYDRAFLEAMRGDYRRALDLLESAAAIFAKHKLEDMQPAAQRARAEIYLELGMPAEARELAASSAAAFAKQDMTLDAQIARILEARGWLLLNDPDKAEEILSAADQFYAKQRIRPRRGATMLYRARAALSSNDPTTAAKLARQARNTFSSLGMWRPQSEAARLLAEAALAKNRPADAEKYLAPAIAATRHLFGAERWKLWAIAGRVARRRGQRGEARRRLQRAVRHIEAQRRFIPGTELRARAFEEHARVYRELLALMLESPAPRFDQIFPLVEAARARGFRERMDRVDAGVRDGITQQRTHLSSLVRRVEEAEYPEEGPPRLDAIRRLHREVLRVEKDLKNQIQIAEGLMPGAAAWGGPPEAATISKALGRDEALIEYFITEEGILALVLTRREQTLRILTVSESDLRAVVTRMSFQLDSMALSPTMPPENLDFLRHSAEVILQDLHQAVLMPLEDLLPDHGRLIVVPHGFMHRIPFECLWNGKEYIDSRFVISRAPTADFLLRRSRRRRKRKAPALICGSIQSGLAAVEQEIEAIARCFPAAEVVVQRDPSTADILRGASQSRLLHLSTHGVFREDNPLFSRLNTSDGALFLIDLLGRKMRLDLVVLSACNSGQVFTGQGDDLSGVAHGFLAAGARHLVASTWRVYDRATEQLMTAFYQHYTSGACAGDPARALTAAGQEIRKVWNHPFFWASFSVHGV